jgi:diguanylate cyclase (GGDEF)-like protein
MQISEKFFNSKTTQQIAILLFFAAVLPALLLTILSNQKISQLVTNYEHKALVEKSRNYALSAFANLTFARSTLEHDIAANRKLNTKGAKLRANDYAMFNVVSKVTPDGVILDSKLKDSIPPQLLQELLSIEPNQTRMFMLPKTEDLASAAVHFITRNSERAPFEFYIAELNTNFIWGQPNDYPADLNVCAYHLDESIRTKIFCSSESNVNQAEEASPINAGAWELFLAAEFHTKPWVVEIHRITPISDSHLKEYIGSTAYISVGILSLLLVGLFTLIQLRKTMVPMENLVEGTRKIKQGVFSPVKVSGNSEFSILASAFNEMSNHIKQQLDTLQSYSTIDQEIISTVDVERVIELILHRMHEVNPNLIYLIANLEESTSNEVQSNCTVIGHAALSSVRLVMSKKELNDISRAAKGQFKTSKLSSQLIHERIMAELGTNHIWVLPIFWQDEVCAFLLAGSKTKLDQQDRSWSEFYDLASRIGIVVSAYRREQKLITEAQYDSLTGLPNRILLQDRLTLATEHSNRTGKPTWVIFVDLDRFKDVNDSYGHNVGDGLLIEIGTRLKAVTRESDTVARFGGDEFVIVLSGDDGEDIQLNVLNRVMDEITKPLNLHNRELINTCSIGISVYPNDGNNAETLIKNADIAMYRAKELGRNNYQFFKQSLNDGAAQRMQVITLMRKAIDRNEFSLHYQPKVDLKTGKVAGLEALLRWENEKLGKVSPAQFIPIAEEAGLIISIGEWVLRTACTQMAECQDNRYEELLMSVNVSAKQLTDLNFIEKLKNILIETGLKAEYLELELTETMLMSGDKAMINKLHAIKALGIQLSIDDFGTGYSNLSYLHTMPIDTLKIDKSFIDTISLNKTRAPIVDTIINLAKNLSLKVVAEGVETLEQTNYLKAQGCEQIQGYYFSKPLTCIETKALLDSGKKLSLPKLVLVDNKRQEL